MDFPVLVRAAAVKPPRGERRKRNDDGLLSGIMSSRQLHRSMFGEIRVTLAGGGNPLPELNRHSLLEVFISIRDHLISTVSVEVHIAFNQVNQDGREEEALL